MGFTDFLANVSPGGKEMLGGLNQYLDSPLEAAKIQSQAQLRAMKMQQGMFNKIVGQEQPFLQGGYASESSLRDLLGLNGPMGGKRAEHALENLPGYQFQKRQGDMATQSASSVTGSALGGASLKALSNYNQGLASTYYNNYVSNLLQNTGLGLNAASNTGTAGTSLGTSAAQAEAASGASLGAGIIGQNQNMGQFGSSLATLIGSFI